MIESRTSALVVSSAHPAATATVAAEMAKVFSAYWPEDYPVGEPFCVTVTDDDGNAIEYNVAPLRLN